MLAGLGLGVHNAGLFSSLHGLGDTVDTYDPVTGEITPVDVTTPGSSVFNYPIPLDPSTGLPVGTPSLNVGSGGGGVLTNPSSVTPAQIAAIINSSVGGAANLYKALQSPAVVPGSSVIYNPSTGQFLSAAGSGVITPLGSAAVSSSGFMWLALAAGAAILLLGGRK